MYTNWDNYLIQDNPRKHFKNPSFSSVLLDQIFHSIDKDNNLILKNINTVNYNSSSDNDSMSFTTSSRSSSSVHSFSSSEYSSVAYKSSKPKPKTPKTPKTHNNSSHNPQTSKNSEHSSSNSMIKSKSRAMKIYSNLKKMKQPSSPCGKLSSFINSLFTSENSKNMKNKNGTTTTSSRTSTPSLPRSCLSKNVDDIKRRNVRFCPVSSMILDDGSYPWGHRANVEVKKYDEFVRDMRNVDDEDGFSDCSEDLFEIDHLGLFGNERFCDELPVYGTTHVNRSCIIH